MQAAHSGRPQVRVLPCGSILAWLTGVTVRTADARPEAPAGKARLLYVEDDQDSRDVTAAFLAQNGFVVTTAATAEQAAAALTRGVFDLVLAGRLRTVAGGEYPLSQARRAHEDLRARRTAGKLVLDPSG